MAAKGFNPNSQGQGSIVPSGYDEMMGSVVPNMTPVEALNEGMPRTPPPMPIEGGSTIVPNPNEIPTADNTLQAAEIEVEMEGRGALDATPRDARPYPNAEFDPTEVVLDGEGNELDVAAKQSLFNQEQAYQTSRLEESQTDFRMKTRDQVEEAYVNNLKNGPPELDAVFSLGEQLANGLLALSSRIDTPDSQPSIGNGADTSQILANEFNASPLEVINASTETATMVLLSLGQGKLRGEAKREATEDEFDIDSFLDGTDDETIFSDKNGLMGVEEKAAHSWLFASTNTKLRGSNRTEGSETSQGVGGQILAKTMEQAGYWIKDDYQPLAIGTGVAKGPMVKAYLLTEKGMAAGASLYKFRAGRKLRGGAQAVSGNQRGFIGDIGTVAQKPDSKRAGTKGRDRGTQLLEGMAKTVSNATKVVDTNMLDMSATMLAGLNGEQDSQGAEAGSFAERFRVKAQDILNIDQKSKTEVPMFGGEPETIQIPISESQKFKKARDDIKNANDLHARIPTHKTPTFQDPSSGRLYYMNYDSNGQESMIHRSSVKGVASNLTLSSMPEVLNNTSMVKANQFAAYETWLTGKGNATPTTRYVSYMIALGNNLIRGSRDYTNRNTLQKLTGTVVREAAQKGRSLQKFIALNGETQNKVMTDLKTGVTVQGLTPAEQGDILHMMDQVTETGSQKEFGAIFRAYDAAAKMEDAHNKGIGSLMLSLPTAADMKSAGRMFAAVDSLDDATVSRVGLALNDTVGVNPSRDLSHIFPVGNPRMFYTDALIAGLRTMDDGPRGAKGFAEFTPQFGTIIATHLSKMMSAQGPTFADMTAKLILMVTDYGKAASQNSDEVNVFLRKAKKAHPEIFQSMEDAFAKEGHPEGSMEMFFQESMWNTTSHIVKSKNSRTVKRMAEAMALFNRQPYYVGVRGMRVRVGRGVQQVLPESTLKLQSVHSQEVINLMSKNYVDDPLQASAPKMLEDGKTYYTPGIASAAVNAMGPAMGHSRESAAMAIALEMVVERLGEGIFVDQVYDSVTLEPEAAMLYEHYLNETAIFEVLEVNDAFQLSQAFEETVMAELRDIRGRGSVSVGPKGEYSGWTTKLDEEWAAFNKPADINVIKSDAFRKRMADGDEKLVLKLFAAQEAGLWNPIGTEVMERFGKKFIPRTPDMDVWMVDGNKFVQWAGVFVVKPLRADAKKVWRAHDSKERRDLLARMKKVHAKGFQKGGLPF